MATTTRSRRLCPDAIVDYNLDLIDTMGEENWSRLKAVKTISLNVGVIAFSAFAIDNGAEPTLTMSLTLTLLALVNGIEVTEWLAAKRAYDDRQGGSDAQ